MRRRQTTRPWMSGPGSSQSPSAAVVMASAASATSSSTTSPRPPRRSQMTQATVAHAHSSRPLPWRARLEHAWDSVQVELHGCYSANRMRALHAYSQGTTHTRTALVLVLTPLPCLLAVAFADCIPLAPPELGIEHSGGFWIRACFASWVYSYSTMEQMRYFIPELPITGWTTLALSIPVMALTNLCTFFLAWAIGFPLPFTIPMLSMPWAVFMIIALWLRLGAHFRAHPEQRKQLLQFVSVSLCQMSLLIIYPAYNAVFFNLSTTAQALFALLLPVIKLAEKNVISLFMRHMEDLKPEHIIFNVEIFNALFIACCMQNANSIVTNFVLVGVDFVMACISLRDLDCMLSEVHELATKMNVEPSELHEAVLLLCQQHPQLESQATDQLSLQRLRLSRSQTRSQSKSHYSGRTSGVPHLDGGAGVWPQEQHDATLVATPVSDMTHMIGHHWYSWRTHPIPTIAPLDPAAVSIDGERPPHAKASALCSHTKRATVPTSNEPASRPIPRDQIDTSSRLRSSIASTLASTITSVGVLRLVFPERAPHEMTRVSPAPVESRLAPSLELLTHDEQLRFLQTTLQTLHLTEYLLLIEYVEVMIPIVYSIYLVVLFHLPNRTFYPQLRDMDEQSLRRTVGNVMMNAAFELVSLLLLIRVLRRRLHASPLRQLAFVLDRQWRMVQSKVVLWVVVTLQSTLYHLGADYSFQFAWLKQGEHGSRPPPPPPPHRW